jgi:AAA15 family ATPase/GTPase
MIQHIHIEKYGPLSYADFECAPALNSLIGPNGCGKSWLLDMLALIMMNHQTTPKVLSRKFKHISIVSDAGQHDFYDSFYTERSIENIIMFQNETKTDAIYYNAAYNSIVGQPMMSASDIDGSRKLIKALDVDIYPIVFDDLGAGKSCLSRGTTNIVNLSNILMSKRTALIESPERSLHILISEALSACFNGESRVQTFVATHSPEWSNNKGIINLTNK